MLIISQWFSVNKWIVCSFELSSQLCTCLITRPNEDHDKYLFQNGNKNSALLHSRYSVAFILSLAFTLILSRSCFGTLIKDHFHLLVKMWTLVYAHLSSQLNLWLNPCSSFFFSIYSVVTFLSSCIPNTLLTNPWKNMNSYNSHFQTDTWVLSFTLTLQECIVNIHIDMSSSILSLCFFRLSWKISSLEGNIFYISYLKLLSPD